MTKVTRLTINEGQGAESRRIHLREISGELDAPLETVGQDLRAARLRRGDDLASISRVLKIRREHLEALEEDRFEALPGRTYAVGFVRSYADFLGLDSGYLVERFKAEIAGRTDYPSSPVHVIDEEEERRLPQGWIIIAAVVTLMLAYGAYHLVLSANELLSQPVTPAPPAPVTSQLLKPPAATTAPPQLQPPAAGAGPAGGQPQSAPSVPPVTGAEPQIMANGGPTPSVALPQGHVYGAQNQNPRVVLRAHGATKILVQGPDKKVFFNQILKPGDTYQAPNAVGLTLTTPNGGAVEVDLDGQELGLAGKQNQTSEAVSLDPQALVDRYNAGGG